jgi:hypothetical protein
MNAIAGITNTTFPAPVPAVPKAQALKPPTTLNPIEAATQLALEPMSVTRQKAMAGDQVAMQKVEQWLAENRLLNPPPPKAAGNRSFSFLI